MASLERAVTSPALNLNQDDQGNLLVQISLIGMVTRKRWATYLHITDVPGE